MKGKDQYTALDLRILDNKERKTVSTQSALQDIEPINWSSDIRSGKRKVTVIASEDELCAK